MLLPVRHDSFVAIDAMFYIIVMVLFGLRSRNASGRTGSSDKVQLNFTYHDNPYYGTNMRAIPSGRQETFLRTITGRIIIISRLCLALSAFELF